MSKLATLVVTGGPCLDGPIHVALERATPWSDDEVASVTQVVQTFVAAGDRGAHAHQSLALGQHGLELASPATVAGSSLGYWLRGRGLDVRAFQLLRHLVSRLELPGGAIQRIVAGATGPGVPPRASLPVIDYENETSQYPNAPAQLGFAVYWDDTLSYAKARRVLVELVTPIEGPPVDVFLDYVRPWGALLEGGAFALPLGLPDVMDNVMGTITQLDAFTLELEIPVYQSSELGFDALLNILAAHHARERPIQLVTIE